MRMHMRLGRVARRGRGTSLLSSCRQNRAGQRRSFVGTRKADVTCAHAEQRNAVVEKGRDDLVLRRR